MNAAALACTQPEFDDIDLTLQAYLTEERAICRQINPRIMQLAGSRLFANNGFPYACISRQNLSHYLDSQQENRALWYMHSIDKIDAPTQLILGEAVALLTAANATATHGQAGVSALVHGLYCALNAKKMLPTPTPGIPVHVLEIGPGSGWTSYFLARFGFHVHTVDSNPNLIIAQRYLQQSLPSQCSGSWTQLPWWEFYDFTHPTAHTFSMVIANHMICEIPEWSRRYLSKWSATHLNESGFLFFQAWGDESIYSRYDAMHDFAAYQIGICAVSAPHLPDITLFKKNMPEAAAKERKLFSRIRRKLICHIPATSRFFKTTPAHTPIFAHHAPTEGERAEVIIRAAGISEEQFTNPTFRWCGICH